MLSRQVAALEEGVRIFQAIENFSCFERATLLMFIDFDFYPKLEWSLIDVKLYRVCCFVTLCA
jgi:hypothetical protein